MSKHIILLLLSLTITISLISPQLVKATPSIPAIGDLDPDKSKIVTISGLDAGKQYAWVVKKVTSVTPAIGTKNYSTINTNCLNSNSNGEIIIELGPLIAPGFYRLEVSKTNSNTGSCIPTVNQTEITTKDFSVGGPIGKNCCDWDWPLYDRDRDLCKKISLITEASKKTNCAIDPNTRAPLSSVAFCEPESLQCFNAKTFIVQGKICMDPKDPNFNKDRNIVCGSAGGKEVEGCTNATMPDPKDPTKTIPNPGIATAIGCIHTNPAEFVKDLLKFVLGIGGGLAFLMMLLGAFQMITSAGNPDTLKAGQERLTSAVIGLLFVIFSILILQVIGADILQIPGFIK